MTATTPSRRAGHRNKHRAARGSVTLEGAVVIMVVAVFLLMAAAAGRYSSAISHVGTAAESAARAASLERTPGAARAAADTEAAGSLDRQAMHCKPTVHTDTSGFSVPVGKPATVTSTVSCTIDMSDLTVPGLHKQITIAKTAHSPLDTYRER